MKPLFPYYEPLPSDPLGVRLCETFAYPWKAILRPNHPDGAWETLDKYPLKPRVLWRYWQDADAIVGVRFGNETPYGLIDLDSKSAYHPNQNPEALGKIRAVLEAIGLCRTVLTCSSHSGGLHLWFPLASKIPSFWLATALKVCLEQHGFMVKQGQLETFPNCKNYDTEYQGHRLPLQPATGAALLDDDAQVVAGGLGTFFRQWDSAAIAQDMALLTANVALAREIQTRRKYSSRHNVIKAWREDLETEMQAGWTGHGQTNHLLKTIACYGVVFADQSKEGLVPYIVRTALELPGYQEWCQHKAHIEQRAKDWAKAADGYYWALGTQGCRTGVFHSHNTDNSIKLDRNQARAAEAQQRIQQAVETLEASCALPDAISQRMDAIVAIAHCSRQTLRKDAVLPLWHPQHKRECASNDCIAVFSAVLTPEAATFLPACTDDQARDQGVFAGSGSAQPKAANADEVEVVHTPALQMKGELPDERPSEKALQKVSLGANRFANTESVTVEVGGAVSVTAEGRLYESFPQVVSVTCSTTETGTPDTTDSEKRPPIGDAPTPTTDTENQQRAKPTHCPSLAVAATSRGQRRDATAAGAQGLATAPKVESRVLAPPKTNRKRQRQTIPLAQQILPPHAVLIAPEPVYPELAPDEVRRVTELIGALLQRLQRDHGWTTKHLTLWLAEQFEGRRRSQIRDPELPVLLERLQAYCQSMLATDEMPTGQAETLLQEPPPPD